MPSPQERLADALIALHTLQHDGKVAIKSADLSRTHRERLLKSGFLKEVIKGWYVAARPDEAAGDSTARVDRHSCGQLDRPVAAAGPQPQRQ